MTLLQLKEAALLKDYPYNFTVAAFIVDHILLCMASTAGPTNRPSTSVQFMETLLRSPGHAARIDANLVKSCIMVGTDIF
jgi:hypothetical protein